MAHWKSYIDKILEEARAKGIYDPTTVAKRALDIADDSLVPEHDRMAYHLLKSNGFAPPFIEERQRLSEDAQRLFAERDALKMRWAHLNPTQQRAALATCKARFVDLWRRTLDYNLQAPLALQIPGIRLEFELREFVIAHPDSDTTA
jgi:hypothetical protein